jgi:hypothetical protein
MEIFSSSSFMSTPISANSGGREDHIELDYRRVADSFKDVVKLGNRMRLPDFSAPSFRGASAASEPGIQKYNLLNSWIPGPALRAVPE